MRLSGNEVNAGLVVYKRDVLPGDLFPVVLLLQAITCNVVTHLDTQLTLYCITWPVNQSPSQRIQQ